ncbi:MAG: gamma-glutamylcyclotransferase family protein [Hyphomicrobium sp.]
MTDEKTRYLFLYGTLMSGARGALGTEERLRLARESDSLGPASIAGAHLYDLGDYPGVFLGEDVDARVHGELVLLDKPQVTILWLDEYEGFVHGARRQRLRPPGVRGAPCRRRDARSLALCAARDALASSACRQRPLGQPLTRVSIRGSR